VGGEERRIHPRREFRRELFCYIDGARFDAKSEDISLGGMFLRTDQAARIPGGALVALVVRESGGDMSESVFLFGRVVRHQSTPETGLGLTWDKAVAAGSSAHLLSFLDQVFGIRSPQLGLKAGAGGGLARYVYEFASGGAAAREGAADSGAVATSAEVAEPLPAPSSGGAVAGALTTQIDRRKAQTPCALGATLSFEGFSLHAAVRSMGLTAMYVETPVGPTASDAAVQVRLDLRAGEEDVPLVFDCHVMSVETGGAERRPGLDLAIVAVDESGRAGVFMRHIRQLVFRGMARG